MTLVACVALTLLGAGSSTAKEGSKGASLLMQQRTPGGGQEKNALNSLPGKSRMTPLQEIWLKSSTSERQLISERMGEEGAARWAESMGWTSLLGNGDRKLSQGPDQVYRAPDGTVHVVEAKGGSSPLNRAYGYEQGTPEWAVKSAERICRSQGCSRLEIRAAEQVLEGARIGKLEVHVVRTPHVLGEPGKVVLERSISCSRKATMLAEESIHALSRAKVPAKPFADLSPAPLEGKLTPPVNPTVTGSKVRTPGGTPEVACPSAGEAGPVAERAAKVLKGVAVVAIVADVGQRSWNAIETERAYESGAISREERNLSHATNAAGMAGGWAGAWAGGELGAAGGALVGTAICPGVGTAVGTFVGGVAGSIGGYATGERLGKKAVESWR